MQVLEIVSELGLKILITIANHKVEAAALPSLACLPSD